MTEALRLALRCPPSDSAYSVGAIIVGPGGVELSRGYSRELDRDDHAEEVALARVRASEPLRTATLYSTLEPCSRRRSRPRSCTRLILDAGIRRVVIAWREPGLFVSDCQGYELLTAAGVRVVELAGLADQARAANAHLPVAP
jgi:diaminohydroxyphosphoribosylaminopyrimidine deaminase/5-amino-6-(5-phosphoribosylamino)uracil reductase